MRKLSLSAVFAAVFLLWAVNLSAEVPHLIRFQGKVTDTAGTPLNGDYNITFRIYNAETGGTLMWSETQSSVPVNNGIFAVLLGNVSALDISFDEDYWLSMEVNNDGEMTPRQQITSVGYAIRAEVADSISDVSIIPQGAIILWTGASCPTGYSRVTALDGKFLVGGASYNAVAGGSNTHTHSTGSYAGQSHTHSVSSHSHLIGDLDGGGTKQVTNDGGGRLRTKTDGSSTSGASGTSLITGNSGTADSRPEFATVLLCQKD